MQGIPQSPQFVRVSRLASHPLSERPSQLPKPVSQLATAQLPVAHVGVALGVEHGAPHVPQSVSVVVLVSQPLADTPSQFPNPLAHEERLQDRPAHDETPLGWLQVIPHIAQLASVSSGVSQPFESMPSQSPKPELQVTIWQLPDAQLAVALARVHGAPQAVQWLSVLSCVSQPLPPLPSQLP